MSDLWGNSSKSHSGKAVTDCLKQVSSTRSIDGLASVQAQTLFAVQLEG